jgi:hypothetical protein
MTQDRPPTPVEIAEAPYRDPLDGLLSGAYCARAADALEGESDHLVVYIRGSGGDPTAEYRAETAACGAAVVLEPKLTRLSPSTCTFCLAALAGAFRAARLAIAERQPPGELG